MGRRRPGSGVVPAQSVIWQLQIRAVEEIERLRHHFQHDALGEADASAQAQIEGGIIKAYARIAPDTDGTVVDGRVIVTVVASQYLDRQRRTISKDVTQLEAIDNSPPAFIAGRHWCLESPTERQAMPLVVVPIPTLVAKIARRTAQTLTFARQAAPRQSQQVRGFLDTIPICHL